jgi:dCMP deaminase
MDTKRPSKDLYCLNVAKEIAQRGTCFRLKAGAIIVREDQIISTGYVGAPRKTQDCFERNECLRDKLKIPHGQRYEMCRSVHAEQNAIINAARAGVTLFGGTMYLYAEDGEKKLVDAFPCFICKKMIINAGLERFVCFDKDGKIQDFKIEDWVKDWREKDIIDDKHQYGAERNKE